MKKIVVLALFYSLRAMDNYHPIHSTLPQETLRTIIEEKTGNRCDNFFEVACLPTYPLYPLFIFLKNNDYLLNETPFDLARKHIVALRWYMFGQKTDTEMKKSKLIIEETAQTILGLISVFHLYSTK